MKKRSFSFRISLLQMFKTSGFFGSGQIYLKKSFLFYNFVTHDTPEAVNWVSFVSLKKVLLTYSQLGFCGFFSISFFFATVFPNIFSCPTLGVLNKYWVLNNTSNAKNTQYSVAFKLHWFYYVTLHFHYNQFRKLKNVTHWRMSMTVPGEI